MNCLKVLVLDASNISPCWHGFYISSMGGTALVFDNLGINMVSIINKTSTPSLLYLNRLHGEEIDVELILVLVPCAESLTSELLKH